MLIRQKPFIYRVYCLVFLIGFGLNPKNILICSAKKSQSKATFTYFVHFVLFLLLFLSVPSFSFFFSVFLCLHFHSAIINGFLSHSFVKKKSKNIFFFSSFSLLFVWTFYCDCFECFSHVSSLSHSSSYYYYFLFVTKKKQ